MDISLIVSFLAPCLPFLLEVGGKVADGAAQAVGADVWNTAKAIWDKLQPKVEAKEAAKESVDDVAKNPNDKRLQTSLEVQLEKILNADPALAKEIAEILQKAKSDRTSASINAQSYDQSTQINTAGDVNHPTYNLGSNNNSPK